MQPLLLLSMPVGRERIVIIVFLLLLFFWIKAIIDIARGKIRNGSQAMWLLIVIFFGMPGMLIYYIFGRGDGLLRPDEYRL